MGKLAHALSLGTRLTYAPGGETNVPGYGIEVPYTSTYLSILKPAITKISWRAAGDKHAVISVEGANLYQGTKIVLADRIYDGSTAALRLPPDKAFDIATDLAALRSDGTILGRYGAGVPLEKNPGVNGSLTINGIAWDSALGGVAVLKIYPGLTSGFLPLAALADEKLGQPIVSVGGTVIPGAYGVVAKAADVEYFEVAVPQSVVKDISGIIQLKFPFRGKQFEASGRAYDPSTQFSARILGAKLFLIERLAGPWNGTGKDEPKLGEWKIQIAGETIPFTSPCSSTGTANEFCILSPNDRFARLRLEKDAPETGIVLFVKPGREGSYPIPLPKQKPDAPKPELDKDQRVYLNQNDSVWISFKGKALGGVGAVTASGIALDTRAGEKDDSILVLVGRNITSKSGSVDLAFEDKQARVIGTANVTVRPVPEPKGPTK